MQAALIFLAFLASTGLAIEITVLKDAKTTAGSRIELVCEVSDLRGSLEECLWYDPDGNRYRERDNEDGIRVTLDDRRDECVLSINSLEKGHGGDWECEVSDSRETASKFVYVRVYANNEPFRLLLDDDERRVEARIGQSIELLCPSNNRADSHAERPVCKWYSPAGKKYDIVGRHGEIYDHSQDGIEVAGDVDRGECGIIINDVGFQHHGDWKCELLRKSRLPNVPGSEVASAEIRTEIFRTARLDDPEKRLQGYYRGDTDVRISMEVTVDTAKEEFTDFYWIVQRTLKIYEGERECLSSRFCYESSRRRRYRNGGENAYTITLDIDELTREDLETPLVLVKDYRLFNSNVDSREIYLVPTQQDTSNDDEDYDDNNSGRSRFARQRQVSDQMCLINDELLSSGEGVDYPRLCVRLMCKDQGEVDATSMEESKCRRRRQRQKNNDR